MKENELCVLWVKGKCSKNMAFVSNDVICYACSNYIKTVNFNGSEECFHINACRIDCLTADYELGVVAVSESKLKPMINILKYPDLQTVIKTLQNGAERTYLGMTFSGKELLVTAVGDPDNIIIVWNWVACCKMFILRQNLYVEHPENFRMSVNPSMNSEVCIHNSAGVMFLTIEDAHLKMNVESKILYMPWEGSKDCSTAITSDKLNKLTIFDKMGHTNWGIHSDVIHKLPLAVITDLPILKLVNFHDHLLKKKRIVPSCHCWLPSGDIMIGCTNGILCNLKTADMKLSYTYNIQSGPKTFPTKLNAITSMAFNTEALYVGKQNATVWKFVDRNNTWFVKEIIQLDIMARYFIFSPDYNILTISTVDGSIFLYDTKEKFISPLVYYEDMSPVVGIYTPYKSHCLTIRRNGLLEMWNIDYGLLVSALNIKCDVECMEGSPLCSLAFIGTKTGLVYVIDAIHIRKLRIVKVFKPFHQPIKSIKCENFGRYFIIASITGAIFILNAIASSNFTLLGRINIHREIVDTCIFTEDSQSQTSVIILIKVAQHLSKTNKRKNALIEIILPNDFYKSYKAYWRNNSGILDDKIIILHDDEINPFTSAIVFHKNYGFLAYESNNHEIKNIFIDSYKHREIKLSIPTIHETKHCKILLNSTHNWLASVGNDGKVVIYELTDLSCIHIAKFAYPFTKTGSISLCFMQSKAILITGSEDGTIICHAWNPKDSHKNYYPPPWNVHCWSWKETQNKYISKILKPVKNLKVLISWESKCVDTENKKLIEKLIETNLKLEGEKADIYKKMSYVADRNYALPPEYQLKTENLFLDQNSLLKMESNRITIILSFGYELYLKLQKMKNEALRIRSNNIDRILVLRRKLKPLRQGHELYNFSYCEKSQEHKDRMELLFRKKQCQIGDELPLQITNDKCKDINKAMSINNFLLCSYFDLKSREQIIDQVTVLRDTIHEKKVEFNKKFDSHALLKESQKAILLHKIARLKFLNSVLQIDEEVWEPDWEGEEDPEAYFQMPPLEMPFNGNSKRKMKQFYSKLGRDAHLNSKKEITAEMESLIKPKDEEEGQILSDITKPEFMEEVLPIHWTKSEMDIVDKFTFKLNRHEAVKKQYKGKLKQERKGLNAEVENLVSSFDSANQDLLTEKLNIDFYINFNELTMAIILFVLAVNDQLMKYDTYLRQDILSMQDQNQLISMIESASDGINVLTKIYEEQLSRDKEIGDIMKIFRRQNQNYNALAAAIRIMQTISASFSEANGRSINCTNMQILISAFAKQRPKRVSKNTWKSACGLLIHKFISEKNLKQWFMCLNNCKQTLKILEKREEARRNDLKNLTTEVMILHQKKLLTLNDIPCTFSIEYSKLEIEKQVDITTSCFMVHKKHPEEWSLKAAEMKLRLFNTIKRGARVRHDLKTNFTHYRRLNFKIEEYQEKLDMIEGIPLTKDLKTLLASSEIDPYAKYTAFIHSAEHEEQELTRQIAAAEVERKKVEKEIVLEITRYKNLEKRINTLKRDLFQLNQLNEEK